MAKAKVPIDSRLDPPFAALSKPAQRALINAGIFTVESLAARRRAELAALHGLGPGSFPLLEAALMEAGLRFRE